MGAATGSHPLADDGSNGHLIATADRHEQPLHYGSRHSEYTTQVEQFRHELRQGGRIDMRNLRAFAFYGIPDGGGLRAIAWKLLLGYLPPDQRQWEETLRRKRAEYSRFCKDLIINPNGIGSPASSGSEADDALGPAPDPLAQAAWAVDVSQDDHPLSTSSGSKWREFFKDNETLEQIDRDVKRTHPDMHFFSGDDAKAVAHRQEMCRALFIFAKLNPGLTYVQGMNELYAPLYYLCAHESGSTDAEHAEADAWYCFVDLISDFRDHFCKQLDNSNMGIKATLSRLNAALKVHDRELWYHLEVKNQVNPQFYAFRWITLLLTQEYSFPDVVRLWDTLLTDPGGRADCLLRVCIAMLVHVRAELLAVRMQSPLLQNRVPPACCAFASSCWVDMLAELLVGTAILSCHVLPQ